MKPLVQIRKKMDKFEIDDRPGLVIKKRFWLKLDSDETGLQCHGGGLLRQKYFLSKMIEPGIELYTFQVEVSKSNRNVPTGF